MAALIADALTVKPPARSMGLESHGRCLIYTDGGSVIECRRGLCAGSKA